MLSIRRSIWPRASGLSSVRQTCHDLHSQIGRAFLNILPPAEGRTKAQYSPLTFSVRECLTSGYCWDANRRLLLQSPQTRAVRDVRNVHALEKKRMRKLLEC